MDPTSKQNDPVAVSSDTCSNSCVPAPVPPKEEDPETREAANYIAEKWNADVLLYSGGLQRGNEVTLRNLVFLRRKRPNVFFTLVTAGGDADVAYLVAKCLQCNYEKFIFFVSGICKSAGTIIALGAHDLSFSQCGELGPLDVQFRKKDELMGQESGWAVETGLLHLGEDAYATWDRFFWNLYRISQGQISVQTAATIAANLTIGLFAPIYSQISPVYLGEADRALSIARRYGDMLDRISKNLKPKGLNKLIQGYPSHGFVIDKHEADRIFHRLRCSEPCEERLRIALGEGVSWDAAFNDVPTIKYLSDEMQAVETKGDTHDLVKERPERSEGDSTPENRGEAETVG